MTERPAEASDDQSGDVTRAPDGEPAPGFPEPPGKDPGDISGDDEPHHALNEPVEQDDEEGAEAPGDGGRKPPPDDLAKDPAYNPEGPLKGIKGG
jgi:hypothetical protein